LNQFVFIFRQGRRLLSPAEQKQRADEVRAWALALKGELKLDPHLLGEEFHQITPDGASVPPPPGGEGSIVAIVFLETADFSAAVKIAETHPGPRYGNSVEVRAWSLPPTLANPKPAS
jgi:hypothetical protein